MLATPYAFNLDMVMPLRSILNGLLSNTLKHAGLVRYVVCEHGGRMVLTDFPGTQLALR